MCLATRKPPFITEEDITCYKVLRYHRSTGRRTTPYRYIEVDVETLNGDKPFKAEGEESMWRHVDDYDMIGCGFIHTYSNEDIAWLKDGYKTNEIWECIIPKGTKYYEGMDFDYASKEIRFIRKIVI